MDVYVVVPELYGDYRNFQDIPFLMVLRRMFEPYVDSTFIVFTDKAYI